jgi:hypothetical protein
VVKYIERWSVVVDWSLLIAGIAFVVSVTTPIFTTIFNNRFQLKLKDREILANRKLDTIENYLKSASEARYVSGVPVDFSKNTANIFLYAPVAIQDKIRELNRLLESMGFSEDAATLLYDVATALKNENKVC